MPSFDLVSKVDIQTLDNAINVVSKEITNRFDFKGSHVVIDLNKKECKINIEDDREMKIDPDLEVSLPSIEEIASKFLKGLENVKGSLIFRRLFTESLQSTFE